MTVFRKSGGGDSFFLFGGNGGGKDGIESLTFDGRESKGRKWNKKKCGKHKSFAFEGQKASGGAIACCNSLTGGVHNSIFVGNSAAAYGDFLRSSSFNGAGFSNAPVTGIPSLSGVGGAITCWNLIGDVQNSLFADNSAGLGGAIACVNFTGEGGAFADLGGSYFLKNEVTYFGGAVLCCGDARLEAHSGDVIFQGNRTQYAVTFDGDVQGDYAHQLVITGRGGRGKTIKRAAPLGLGGHFPLRISTAEQPPVGLFFLDLPYYYENGIMGQKGIMDMDKGGIMEPPVGRIGDKAKVIASKKQKPNGRKTKVALAAAAGRSFRNYDPIDAISTNDFHLQINPKNWQTGTVLFDSHRSVVLSLAEYPSAETSYSPEQNNYAFLLGKYTPYGAAVSVSNGTMVLQNGASFTIAAKLATEYLQAPMGVVDTQTNGVTLGNYQNELSQRTDGTFRLEKPAILRVAYGQDIERYKFDKNTLAVIPHAQPVSYNPDLMHSEIDADETVLEGRLQFVLPKNVDEDVPMLSFPGGVVFLADSVTVDVAISSCGEGQFDLPVGQSVILLDCANLRCASKSFPNCDGSSIVGARARSGYHFDIRRENDRLLADFLGYFGGLGAAPIGYKSLSEGWLAGTALVNGCGDRLEIPSAKKLAAFCALGGGAERHRSGSAIKLDGASFVAGL
ncbi:MAG: hypothetical protein LBH53_01270, partial [Puniceicoccales bacterium]|nr:hypothetical protein [Puniceicoccales bacterium]